jgi:predicted CoA-binding protein
MLSSRGYRVIPVNPACDELLGERCYPTLAEAAAGAGLIDVVDIFRRASVAGAHVDEAIAVGASAVWMQLGVIDHAAAARARDAGLQVVMDRCPAIEMPRLGVTGPRAG